MAKRVSPLNYTFALGRIRALERFLINSQVFEEALDSEIDEALRLFSEAGLYGEGLLRVKNSQELETVLSQETLKLKKLMAELLLDKKLFCLIESDTLGCVEDTLKIYPSKFLQDYLKHSIDMHNIKSFLRLYILKEPKAKLEAVLSKEGFIKKEDFLSLYSQELTAFLNRLGYVYKDYQSIDYAYYLGSAIQKAVNPAPVHRGGVKENSFVALEKVINDFLIEILKPAKYFSFGPEPLLAYYFAKVNEINLVRMVILAKLNEVPTDLVKERLNLVYA